jgi:gas vesicle protein
MKTEESLEPPGEELDPSPSTHRRAGFASGLMLGILIGAGFALLFAPEQGSKTRGRLKKRMHSLQEEAREGLDRAGARTRKELLRRQRRLKAELERVRARAKEALD